MLFFSVSFCLRHCLSGDAYIFSAIDGGPIDGSFPGLLGALVPDDGGNGELHALSVDIDENSEAIVLGDNAGYLFGLLDANGRTLCCKGRGIDGLHDDRSVRTVEVRQVGRGAIGRDLYFFL